MAKAAPVRQKFDQLGPAGRRLSRVPRYGRLIALLPPERFGRLQTEAATFWEVYTYQAVGGQTDTGVLDSGLRATAAGRLGVKGKAEIPGDPDFRSFQIRRACDVLGALAFHMKPDGRATETERVKKDVVNRMFASKMATDFYGDRIESKGDLHKWLNAVFAMDAINLKYFIFSAHDNREIRWTDITTQAFFAAYWACRWGDDEDRTKLWQHAPHPSNPGHERYREWWSFITEMPDEAIDRTRWEALLTPLYVGSDDQPPIRATEVIYHSWDRMKDTDAGKTFRDEFDQLLAGERGEKLQQVARGLVASQDGESHFLPLCQKVLGEEDSGEFMMGAPRDEDPEWDMHDGKQENPLHRVKLTAYRLHRYCVTNEQYELFDPRHEELRKFKDTVADVTQHPVVNVSWYDAWCFATWLGQIPINGKEHRIQLPTEAQWEYACRAGQSTPFTWDEDRSGEKIESDYCNFDGNFPWNRPGTPEAKTGPTRNCTVRVDGRDQDGTRLPANRWGFHQLHGNVWEWCADWLGPYDVPTSQEMAVQDPQGVGHGHLRVLRGGSWIDDGGNCRSAHRDAGRPGFRFRDDGVRLAAVALRSPW